MISVKLTVETDILEAIAEAARTSPKLMQTAYDRNTRRLRSRMIKELSTEPRASTPPIRWKNARQKRAVMRKLRLMGMEDGYVRSHALSKAWKANLKPDGTGGIMTVTNNTPYVEFVQGDWTQPFHLDTGWPQAGDIFSRYRVEAEDVLIATWFTIVDDFAGVRR